MDDARVGRVVGEFVEPGDLLQVGDGGVVGDEVSAIVSLGRVFAAVAEPENVPVVAVGGVCGRVGGDVEEELGAFGEFGHLGEDSYVPVHVVFHD